MGDRIWVNHLGITSHPDRLSFLSFRVDKWVPAICRG